MHSVVCIKQVPDSAHIRVHPVTNTIMRQGVPAIVNPYDLYAIEAALRLKDRCGGRVTAISMGPTQAEPALRKALSLGCDEAILVTDRLFAGADTLATSYVLASAIRALGREQHVDLVFTGKQTIDGDTAQVGPGIAVRLGMRLLSYVARIADIDPAGRRLVVERRAEGGVQVLETRMPALLTILEGDDDIRFASTPGMLRAARSDIRHWDRIAAGIEDIRQVGLKGRPTIVSRVFAPAPRSEKAIPFPFDSADPDAGATALLAHLLDAVPHAVILADGANALVTTRAWLRRDIRPEAAALAVKEVIFMPRETIDARFNLNGLEGTVIEMLGSITQGMLGTGFLYTNKDSISIGIGCMLADLRQQSLNPVELLERMKAHPAIAPLIAGGEPREYAAHLIPEGGYDALPQLFGDGWMMVGDTAGFVNAAHREGSNLAMTTGQMAAETLVELFREKRPATAANLARYRARLDESFVMKDMKKYRRLLAPGRCGCQPHHRRLPGMRHLPHHLRRISQCRLGLSPWGIRHSLQVWLNAASLPYPARLETSLMASSGLEPGAGALHATARQIRERHHALPSMKARGKCDTRYLSGYPWMDSSCTNSQNIQTIRHSWFCVAALFWLHGNFAA